MEKEDSEAKQHAADVLNLLNQIEDGTREAEFEARAKTKAEYALDTDDGQLGMPPNMRRLDNWISASPDVARDKIDDIALLVGQSEVNEGGCWKINLAIEKTVVIKADGTEFNPFEFIAKRFPQSHFSN